MTNILTIGKLINTSFEKELRKTLEESYKIHTTIERENDKCTVGYSVFSDDTNGDSLYLEKKLQYLNNIIQEIMDPNNTEDLYTKYPKDNQYMKIVIQAIEKHCVHQNMDLGKFWGEPDIKTLYEKLAQWDDLGFFENIDITTKDDQFIPFLKKIKQSSNNGNEEYLKIRKPWLKKILNTTFSPSKFIKYSNIDEVINTIMKFSEFSPMFYRDILENLETPSKMLYILRSYGIEVIQNTECKKDGSLEHSITITNISDGSLRSINKIKSKLLDPNNTENLTQRYDIKYIKIAAKLLEQDIASKEENFPKLFDTSNTKKTLEKLIQLNQAGFFNSSNTTKLINKDLLEILSAQKNISTIINKARFTTSVLEYLGKSTSIYDEQIKKIKENQNIISQEIIFGPFFSIKNYTLFFTYQACIDNLEKNRSNYIERIIGEAIFKEWILPKLQLQEVQNSQELSSQLNEIFNNCDLENFTFLSENIAITNALYQFYIYCQPREGFTEYLECSDNKDSLNIRKYDIKLIEETLKCLINKGFDSNAQNDRTGYSLLHHAVINDETDIISELLNNKVQEFTTEFQRNLTPKDFGSYDDLSQARVTNNEFAEQLIMEKQINKNLIIENINKIIARQIGTNYTKKFLKDYYREIERNLSTQYGIFSGEYPNPQPILDYANITLEDIKRLFTLFPECPGLYQTFDFYMRKILSIKEKETLHKSKVAYNIVSITITILTLLSYTTLFPITASFSAYFLEQMLNYYFLSNHFGLIYKVPSYDPIFGFLPRKYYPLAFIASIALTAITIFTTVKIMNNCDLIAEYLGMKISNLFNKCRNLFGMCKKMFIATAKNRNGSHIELQNEDFISLIEEALNNIDNKIIKDIDVLISQSSSIEIPGIPQEQTDFRERVLNPRNESEYIML